jgi:hypothetical protein
MRNIVKPLVPSYILGNIGNMRKRALLVAIAVLALGLIGTVGSSLFQQPNEVIFTPYYTVKASYGFPLSWHGYSEQIVSLDGKAIYWYSVEYLLIDTGLWFAVSFFVCIAILKTASILRNRRASTELLAKEETSISHME